MGRLRSLLAYWEQLERRLQPILPCRGPLRLLCGLVLVLVCGAGLLADYHYLRTLPGMIPNDDVFAYECYARAFWQGGHALLADPLTRYCSDPRWLFWTAPPQAFHTLPREYPAPSVLFFSLPLLFPFASYAAVYEALLGVIVFAVLCVFVARGLLGVAAAFGAYILIGGWATALARYDLAPGLLVLGALMLARRSRYTGANVLVAVAALLKVYPGFIAPLLWIYQWRLQGRVPRRQVAAFWITAAIGTLPGALLNLSGFLSPLRYNGVRPPQIESLAGSLYWLSGRFGAIVHVRLTYHSVNLLGPAAGAVASAATVLFLLGVAYLYLRAWRGYDSLEQSVLLALLVMLCTSKLLSPQYLLWLFPVAAYVEGLRLRWLVVAGLTLAIYPYGYSLDTSLIRLPTHPLFMGLILGRNAVLVGIGLVALYQRRRVWSDVLRPGDQALVDRVGQPVAPDLRLRA